MDLGFILLQVTTAAVQNPGATLAATLDASKDGGFSAIFSHNVTNVIASAWGGKRERPCPPGIILACMFVFGVIGVMIAFAMRGVNPFDPAAMAAALGLGITSGGPGAAATRYTQDFATPSLPAVTPSTAAPTPDPTVAPEAPYTQPVSAESPEPPPPAQFDRAALLVVAEGRTGLPYQIDPPPDGVHNTDCSQFVELTYKDAGLPFPGSVRTAEQLRQACNAIGYGQILPGDLLFFEHTYEPTEPLGPDGHVASHVALSYGPGTFTVIQAVESGVGKARIDTPYWQAHLLGAGRHPSLDVPAAAPVAPSGGLIPTIDTSSFQPTDLTALIGATGAEAVIVKLYQAVENIGGRITGAQHSAAQIASTLAAGKRVGGYIWGYASRDPVASVQDGLTLARSCGVTLRTLWLDIEPYADGSTPDVDWIRAALAECERQGVRGGIYSGAWVWDRIGQPILGDYPLWTATYDGIAGLDHLAPYGGLRIVGHQFSTDPCDRSVMLEEAV